MYPHNHQVKICISHGFSGCPRQPTKLSLGCAHVGQRDDREIYNQEYEIWEENDSHPHPCKKMLHIWRMSTKLHISILIDYFQKLIKIILHMRGCFPVFLLAYKIYYDPINKSKSFICSETYFNRLNTYQLPPLSKKNS